MPNFFVYVFHIANCVDDTGTTVNQLWAHYEEIERQVKRDGWEVKSQDGDGLMTYVEFGTEAEMIMFKLTYGI